VVLRRIFFTSLEGQGAGGSVIVIFIIFVLFIIIFIVVCVFVRVVFAFFIYVDDGTGFGEIEAVGGGLDGEDYVGGVGLGVEVAGVVAG
jgi:hypothetical protein